MLFLQCLCEGVDKIPTKELSPRSIAMKKANVEGKRTSSKRQKIEDTSSDLTKAILNLVYILSQIEDNKLKAQLSMHDSTLNRNRELASMKQQLQFLLAKQEMEFKFTLANLKKNKEDKEIEGYRVFYVFT